MNTKEKKQKAFLDKVMGDSFRKQRAFQKQTYRETFEKLMRRNKQQFSPTGGKPSFGKTKDEK